jgi:hypothetical protein
MRRSNPTRQHDLTAPKSTPSSTMIPSLLVKPSRPLLRYPRLLRRHSMLHLQCPTDSRPPLCHPCPRWPQSLLYHRTFSQPTPLHSYQTCSQLQVTVCLQSFSRMASLLNLLDPTVKQALVTVPLQPHLVLCCLFLRVWACRLVHILQLSLPMLVPPSILRLRSVCLRYPFSPPLDHLT